MTTYPNWFGHYAQGFFETHLAEFVGKPGLRFLQIGAFTGDASVWLLENILTDRRSVLVDVDTWTGSDEVEHQAFDWNDVRDLYYARMDDFGGRVDVHEMTSREYFAEPHDPLDFIYIDGDHTAPGVLSDAIHSFDLLIEGGLLAFDDYLWKPSDGSGETHAPGIAIDAFLDCYRDRIQVLRTGLQVWVRKIA